MSEQRQFEEEIDLVDYIKVIYKYRKMIAIVILLTVLFTGIYSLCKPELYEASATFFPISTEYNIQSQGITMQPRLEIENLIVSILESRKMTDRIIEQLDLKKIWNQKLTSRVRKKLSQATKINLDKNGIIRLSVVTESPELSANIANAYVDNLDYFNRELEIGVNKQIVQVIDRATVPEERLPRGIIKTTLLAAVISVMFSTFLAFLAEFITTSNLFRRIKE